MSSNKPTDPRMTKTEDPKSIYYQYSSLKKLLSEEDIQLMQPLEDSLKQQGQLKPPFGKCYFCKDPSHWIGDCPEAKKPRSQQAAEQKKPPFGQCYNCGSPNHWAPDCPHKNEMDSSSISPSSIEKQQPSTSTEISTVATKKMKRPFGQCYNFRSPNHWTPDCPHKMKQTLQVFLLQVLLRTNNLQLLLRFRHQGNASFLIPILQRLYQARK